MTKLRDRVCFVTSFSPDLYAASGQRLVQSFLKRAARVNDLFVCYENKNGPDLAREFRDKRNVAIHCLDDDPLLTRFIASNLDIIPDYLGGHATHCNCPNWQQRHATHRPGCPYQWMNRNCSRWFRKIVSWVRAREAATCRALIWVDSDSEILTPLSYREALDELFGTEAAVFHFKAKRAASETGVVGFELSRGAGAFIERVHEIYASGAFREQERWDDCVTTDRVIAEGLVPTRDLALLGKGRRIKISDVIPLTPMGKYVRHLKGLHGRILGIMK